ncbi:oxygenase MpaB family protein [Cesiribacter sp. SM1]|uniref:oxygenase MpaB family protein n=1 Tax=Cesiribacter sp. SM1 TaxID=2861196 RepID=UPI001CD4A428|nr:oxygenase MpaB family protein [Cesiribacter sp. SM1]
MEYFVDKHSVVRQIWGKGDTILFIFAGASAEFALNKAVDWLYFTGRLPADPLGRLFSTVSYARAIIFSEKKSALLAIDAMTAIHAGVEAKRGASIPDWAYRDVLFMLIDYSIRVFEVLERELSKAEKQEVLEVFNRVGSRMGVKELPDTFEVWETMRQGHLNQNLQYSHYTDNLISQYCKHLGVVRYRLLLEAQVLVVPQQVRALLGLRSISLLKPMIWLYKLTRSMKFDWLLRDLIMPYRYKSEIKALDSLPL